MIIWDRVLPGRPGSQRNFILRESPYNFRSGLLSWYHRSKCVAKPMAPLQTKYRLRGSAALTCASDPLGFNSIPSENPPSHLDQIGLIWTSLWGKVGEGPIDGNGLAKKLKIGHTLRMNKGSDHPRTNYDIQKDFRKRFLIVLLVFLGALPCSFLIAALFGWALKVKWDNIFPGVFAAWGSLYLASIIYWMMFQCPHCHKSCRRKWAFCNPFSYRCPNCGFPKSHSEGKVP